MGRREGERARGWEGERKTDKREIPSFQASGLECPVGGSAFTGGKVIEPKLRQSKIANPKSKML
jgi:hypothetical protein